jgi:hypothetical protein
MASLGWSVIEKSGVTFSRIICFVTLSLHYAWGVVSLEGIFRMQLFGSVTLWEELCACNYIDVCVPVIETRESQDIIVCVRICDKYTRTARE